MQWLEQFPLVACIIRTLLAFISNSNQHKEQFSVPVITSFMWLVVKFVTPDDKHIQSFCWINAVNAIVIIQNSLNAYQDTKSSFVPRYPELMMHMMSVESQISIVCLANYYGRTKCVVENEIEIWGPSLGLIHEWLMLKHGNPQMNSCCFTWEWLRATA